MAHTCPLTRLLPVVMLAVALVTSQIAAFASSLSSPDPVTGMLVALVPQIHGNQPVQTRWNQVSMHLLFNPPNITPCRCLITPYRFLISPVCGISSKNCVIWAKKRCIEWPKKGSNGYISLVYNTQNLLYNQKPAIYHAIYHDLLMSQMDI